MLDRFFEKMVPDVFQESEQLTKDAMNLFKAKTEEHAYNQVKHEEASRRLDLMEKRIEELSQVLIRLDQRIQDLEKKVDEIVH